MLHNRSAFIEMNQREHSIVHLIKASAYLHSDTVSHAFRLWLGNCSSVRAVVVAHMHLLNRCMPFVYSMPGNGMHSPKHALRVRWCDLAADKTDVDILAICAIATIATGKLSEPHVHICYSLQAQLQPVCMHHLESSLHCNNAITTCRSSQNTSSECVHVQV